MNLHKALDAAKRLHDTIAYVQGEGPYLNDINLIIATIKDELKRQDKMEDRKNDPNA